MAILCAIVPLPFRLGDVCGLARDVSALGIVAFASSGAVLLVTTTSLLAILIFLNMQVYHIYRFHINGMVLSMVMGEGASDIFVFSPLLYLKEGGLLALIALLCVGLAWISTPHPSGTSIATRATRPTSS